MPEAAKQSSIDAAYIRAWQVENFHAQKKLIKKKEKQGTGEQEIERERE